MNGTSEITDLLDDCRTPRNVEELRAAGARLHGVLADAWFRLRGSWSAKGKTIPRRLLQEDAPFAERFAGAFHRLWEGDPRLVIDLAEEILAPHGGLLFAGYALDAPASWRLAATTEAAGSD